MIKFATTLAIAGTFGQINAVAITSEDQSRAGFMERCGKSANERECVEDYYCKETSFINSGGLAETNYVCNYAQEGDLCYFDKHGLHDLVVKCDPGKNLECLPDGPDPDKQYCAQVLSTRAQVLVAEHFKEFFGDFMKGIAYDIQGILDEK